MEHAQDANEIFLPLAGVTEFVPEIVAIMTHELTHALISESTSGLAPRWFHEGLASRLEMTEYSNNAFLKYRDDKYLTVALLDAVAGRCPDPYLVEEAYALSESIVRFIEAKYGRKAIGALLAAFRGGDDTDTAIRRVTGNSLAEIDDLARAWGSTQPPTFTNVVTRYDGAPRRERRF